MAATGVYVAYDPADVESPVVDTTAEKALWVAVERGMKVVFWPFGTALKDAIAAGVMKQPPASRKAPAKKEPKS